MTRARCICAGSHSRVSLRTFPVLSVEQQVLVPHVLLLSIQVASSLVRANK